MYHAAPRPLFQAATRTCVRGGGARAGWRARCGAGASGRVAVEHGAVEEELEQGPVDAWGGSVFAGQLVHDGHVEDLAGTAGEVGFGVAALGGEGVQGEASVAEQVVSFA